MSLIVLFAFAAVGIGPPNPSPVGATFATEGDRTPIRCRPAPYYVAEQGERQKPERLMVTGSRVPVIARDFETERRPRPPCLLMRDASPPNPLRPAD